MWFNIDRETRLKLAPSQREQSLAGGVGMPVMRHGDDDEIAEQQQKVDKVNERSLVGGVRYVHAFRVINAVSSAARSIVEGKK